MTEYAASRGNQTRIRTCRRGSDAQHRNRRSRNPVPPRVGGAPPALVPRTPGRHPRGVGGGPVRQRVVLPTLSGADPSRSSRPRSLKRDPVIRHAGRFWNLLGCSRGEHHALDCQEALIDLPESDFHGSETGVHAAHIRFQPLQTAVYIVNPGVDASDLRRKQARHHKPGSDDGADDRFGVAAHVRSISRGLREAHHVQSSAPAEGWTAWPHSDCVVSSSRRGRQPPRAATHGVEHDRRVVGLVVRSTRDGILATPPRHGRS